MVNHMIGNITKIRLRSYIFASSDVFLPSISSLIHIIMCTSGIYFNLSIDIVSAPSGFNYKIRFPWWHLCVVSQ